MQNQVDISSIFDVDWYISTNKDVILSGREAIEHYQNYGWLEGRSPHPLFDAKWYLETNSDVVAAGKEPLFHYMNYGWREGRQPHPLFDAVWYLETYSDVRIQDVEPLSHYLKYGWHENRKCHPLFDPVWYSRSSSELKSGHVNPVVHYITTGWLEDLQPNELFFPIWYRFAYLGSSNTNPLIHYIKNRSAHALKPNAFFDPQWYQSTYPDAAVGARDPFEHFLNAGQMEGRNPNPFFDTQWYNSFYKDVSTSGHSALGHFVSIGLWENRKPNEYFDPIWYEVTYAEQLSKAGCKAFEHFILYGVKGKFYQNKFLELSSREVDDPLFQLKVQSLGKKEFIETISRACVASFGAQNFSSYPYVVFLTQNITPSKSNKGGYPERIFSIDQSFNPIKRVYIKLTDEHNGGQLLNKIAENTYLLNINRAEIDISIAIELCKAAKAVYSHSIYAVKDPILMQFFESNHVRILDVHGAVPEELEYDGKLKLSEEMHHLEEKVLGVASKIVCVSQAMSKHIVRKYPHMHGKEFVLLPIIIDLPDTPSIYERVNIEPRLIYAGGMDHWQNYSTMLEIAFSLDLECDIYTLQPEIANNWINNYSPSKKRVSIKSTTDEGELWRAFQLSNYGFILRSKSIINEVACPTKLVQYLASGVVPIFIDICPVGDFYELGIESINIDELKSLSFPSKQKLFEMQKQNLNVFFKIRSQHYEGLDRLLRSMLC